MARPIRIEYAGAVYHVTSRGNERKDIVRDDRDREKFISFLRELPDRFGVIVHGFVLMGNHYHLLIETPNPNLQRAMQYLNTAYTVYFNRRHNRAGHLLQGRYKAFVIEKDSYLIAVSRYLHLNPVRAGIVGKPEDYPWSSYRDYIKSKKLRQWLTREWVLGQFSKDPARARRAYKEFVEEAVGVAENPFVSLKADLILGSERFLEQMKQKLSLKKNPDLPQSRRLISRFSCDEVLRLVSDRHDVRESEIITSRGKGKLARRICLYLLRECTDMTNSEIGARFGLTHSAVRKACTRFAQELKKSKELRSVVHEHIQVLSNVKV